MNNVVGAPLNCGSFVGNNVPTYAFNKPNFSNNYFKLNSTPITRTTSASSSGNINIKDIEYIRSSGANIITDYDISLELLSTEFYIIPTISNSNSGVLSLNQNGIGIASGISEGTSVVSASYENFFSALTLTVTQQAGQVNDTPNGYVSNSLAKHVCDSIDTRISGLNATTTKPIYSVQDHANGVYTRNTSCWANDLDLTCISPYNTRNSHRRAGTLISPRHLIWAAHYQLYNNDRVRFIDNNNNVITRTIINKRTHPSYKPAYPDIAIGLLDEDVPESISFCKVLPSNWIDYLPSLSDTFYVPCLVLDQQEKALVNNLYSLETLYNQTLARFRTPTTFTNSIAISDRYNFYENLISGDSGNPAFLIINNELVLITVWTYGGAGGGTSIVSFKNDINTMMSQLGGGYQLTEIDLSDFPTY